MSHILLGTVLLATLADAQADEPLNLVAPRLGAPLIMLDGDRKSIYLQNNAYVHQ